MKKLEEIEKRDELENLEWVGFRRKFGMVEVADVDFRNRFGLHCVGLRKKLDQPVIPSKINS